MNKGDFWYKFELDHDQVLDQIVHLVAGFALSALIGAVSAWWFGLIMSLLTGIVREVAQARDDASWLGNRPWDTVLDLLVWGAGAGVGTCLIYWVF